MGDTAKLGAETLRIGVVGVGVMGSNHARVLSELPGVKLIGVADPDRKRRETVARNLGCAAFDDTDALLDQGVDAVTIAAPTHLHRDIAIACAARGIHVMVEKPIAPTVEESRAIVAAARRAGVTLMVGHVERFNPAVQSIKRAIQDQDILSIAITRVGPFPPRMSNVGVVIDLAVHDIDLIRWFTDSEIVEIQPQTSSAVAEREDIALLQFRTASGVLAHINTNWLTPFKARTIHIATRDKYLIGDLLTLQVTECFGFQPDGSYSMRHLSVGYAEPLRSELLAFVSAIRTGQSPAVTGDEAVASLEIAIRCLDTRSASSSVPQRQRPAARRRLTRHYRSLPGSQQKAANTHHESAYPRGREAYPFIDVAAQRRRLGRAVDDAVARVLAHCQFVQGPEVREFEAALAAFAGARHAIGCASGTDALLLVLMAWEIGRGDAVICPSFTFTPPQRWWRSWAPRRSSPMSHRKPSISTRQVASARLAPPSSAGSSRARLFRSICSGCRLITMPSVQSRPRMASWCLTTRRRVLAPPIAARSSARWRRRPQPASFRPSRLAAMAMAARCSPTTTHWRRG